ncbi:MAG: hypothetical protein HQ595_01020, partial [Candidatus Omnitrophica bacterium]|nr:hypothetical protein [Candidatus Omnitrophota bacterium]
DTGFENRHTYRMDLRTDDDDYTFYLTRVSAVIDFAFDQIEQGLKFIPFFEYQTNLDTNNWWRKELGAEIGLEFFEGFFYYGASLQHVWQQQENYPVEKLEETTEWESRFVFNPKINWWLFKDYLDLIIFEEYTYDFTRGQGTFNEVGVLLDWRVSDWLNIPFGFRHVDRVHDYDADALEISAVLSF